MLGQLNQIRVLGLNSDSGRKVMVKQIKVFVLFLFVQSESPQQKPLMQI